MTLVKGGAHYRIGTHAKAGLAGISRRAGVSVVAGSAVRLGRTTARARSRVTATRVATLVRSGAHYRIGTHAKPGLAGINRRAGVSVFTGQDVVAVHATAGRVANIICAAVVVVAVNQPGHEQAAHPGRTAVGGAGVGVITSSGATAHADADNTLVTAGTGVAITAGRIIGKVGATVDRVADIVGTDFTVAAFDGRTLANAGRTAGVADGADTIVIAGADFSRAISSTTVAGYVVAVVAGLASLDYTVAAFGSHYYRGTKGIYRHWNAVRVRNHYVGEGEIYSLPGR